MLLYRELVNFGLSEKEARVYLAALELGPTSVQNLAKKANVNRATAYTNIEVLLDMKLLNLIEEGKKTYYTAVEPEQVAKILHQKSEEELVTYEAIHDEALPLLKAIQKNVGKIPHIRYFEGKEGIRSLVREVYKSGADDFLRIMYPRDLIARFFNEDELNELTQMREQRNIKFKAIYTGTAEDSIPKDTEKVKQFISTYVLNLKCDIAFIGNQVRIISLEEPVVGIAIQDQAIADSFKNIFDYIYEAIQDGLIK